MSDSQRSTQKLFDLGRNLFCGVGGISEQHVCVLVEKDWILNISIACTHSALHENNFLRLPNFNNWHACQWVVRAAFLSALICSVVGTNNQACVNRVHVRIHLFHLLDPIIRHACLGKQHIHLTRHTASHRVNAKADLSALIAQRFCNLSDRVLATCHCHTIAWNNHHRLGFSKGGSSAVHIGFGVLLHRTIIRLFDSNIDSTKNDIHNISVHCVAHNLREDGPAETNEGTDDCDHWAVEQESLRHERPTTVGIEHCDAHWHVGTTNTVNQMESHSI
mmetsp:Transcript_112897/g.176403  ORF Transcript_112897/g.176403 Transcript_112897/m.176403 type:complete len:277 (-) Transcript_112897:586-1416(-)